MKNSIRYFIVDEEKKILQVFDGELNENKLHEFVGTLPNISKDGTFPILQLSRINGEITCNLDRYDKSESIKNKHYRILEYQVKKEDLDCTEFLDTKEDCCTNAYNIYVKWEELPAIVNYIERIDLFGPAFTMDFALVYQLLEENTSQLQQFQECFTFHEVDAISFDEIQFILEAAQYRSLHLEDAVSFFRKAFENGKRNTSILRPNVQYTEENLDIIPQKSDDVLLLEKMKQEKNAIGRYAHFLEGIADMEEVYQYSSNRSFTLHCLSDEEDLYTYQVLISFPRLYEFMTYLDENYKVIKEETFQELEWDCYENRPILNKVIEEDIMENNGYRLLDFDVAEENIHIRTQKAEKVYVKWEESTDLFRYINDLIASLIKNAQVDWSMIAEKFDALSVDEQEKKQLYHAFFSCFQFGEPKEVLPNDIIMMIENHVAHPLLNLQHQKMSLQKRKKLARHNREFFALLLENDIVSFPKRLVSKISKF